MPLAGLTLPSISAFDPPTAAEGSLDPVGLAAISDRLADLLVPGIRARMSRVRFVTAMAVGALVCEPLLDTPSKDNVSTPAVCFEWLVVEAFVRRLHNAVPPGVPGSLKARNVISRQQRLSASTYLKAPSVFGFHGVYKPFAVDSRVVSTQLEPGRRCVEVARAWEQDQGLAGFIDEFPGTEGGLLRRRLRTAVGEALAAGRCGIKPGGHLFGQLAGSLRPDQIGPSERRVLRSLITDHTHDTRAELGRLVADLDPDLTEAELLEAVRPTCSPSLGQIIDAVVAYERFAALVDAGFRTLCSISRSLGSQPLNADSAKGHETIERCAAELPDRYRHAADCTGTITSDIALLLEERLGAFGIVRTPADLVNLLLTHHEHVQAKKPPNGKRPWFEPFRGGWIVRGAYGSVEAPELGPKFVHPVRVAPLRQFMEDTADE